MTLEDQYKQKTGKEAIATYKSIPCGTGAGFTSKLVIANYNNDFVEWLKKRDEYKTRRYKAAEKILNSNGDEPHYEYWVESWQAIVNEKKYE